MLWYMAGMDSQDTVSRSSKLPRWPGYLLGLYAVVCGVIALLSIDVYPPGWAIYARPLLAVWGIGGGLLLLVGDPWWRPLLQFWTLAQAAVVVIDPSGDLTRQPGFFFGVQQIAYSTVNDQVVQARGYGVNFWGVFLFLLTQWIISRKWYATVPTQLWQFQALRAGRLLLVLATLTLLGYVGWRWAPLVLEKNPLMVITCPPPGAEIYMEERKLGSTPLVVTEEKLVKWGLSRAGGARVCSVSRTGLDDGFYLMGNSRAATVLLKPPWWCEDEFVTYPTPWGPRAVPVHDTSSPKRLHTLMIAKDQPGLVLGRPDSGPESSASGEPIKVPVVLWRNPADPRIKVTAPPVAGARAGLAFTFARGSSYTTETAELPERWSDPEIGANLSHVAQVEAPRTPGQYSYRIQYRLYASTNTARRLDDGWVRTYGYLEVK